MIATYCRCLEPISGTSTTPDGVAFQYTLDYQKEYVRFLAHTPGGVSIEGTVGYDQPLAGRLQTIGSFIDFELSLPQE